MERTINEITRTVTLAYLDTIDPKQPPSPEEIEANLLHAVRMEVEIENALRDKKDHLKKPSALTFAQIADVMVRLYPICRVSCAGENLDGDNDLLAMYQTDGQDKGIYVTNEDTFRSIARRYNYNLTQREFQEVLTAIRDMVPRKRRCCDRDLIIVNNGIFDYRAKKLMPFDPELVFLTKSHVDYNPNVSNPVIHNPDDGTDWDVESWIADLSDDDAVVASIWEILSAIVRPHVRWMKAAFLVNNQGNNGKGTLCELMRNLVGPGAYTSIPISDFGKDFMLEPLTRAQAIIVDENDADFIDRAANLKAVITNDVIQINRKFKQPIAYQFYGFMVQCLNGYPKIKDRTDSTYRRQLFLPFDRCFTGAERRYIKTDYIHRKEVLEYVLWKILNTDFYELSEPAVSKAMLDEYKEYNDPIRQFANDLLPRCRWDLLPFEFLYKLYQSWFKRNAPSGQIVSSGLFATELVNIVNTGSFDYFCKDRRAKIRVGKRMDLPEPLILEYDLKDCMNPSYRGSDPDKICLMPIRQDSYRGLMRKSSSAAPNP